MKKLTFLLLSFCYAWTQAAALNCSASCVFHEHDKQQKNCHSEEKSSDETSDVDCLGSVNGLCFHESLSVKHSQSSQANDVFPESEFASLKTPLVVDPLASQSEYRYRPKIFDQYIVYKSRLSLYLLKDQFLI